MPKIIENIKEKLIEVARRQVMESGYSAMTIRSVAGECKVGVGTVYNYFESKEMLVAEFILKDWLECRSVIVDGCKDADKPYEALECVYNELKKFSEKYAPVFKDEGAGQSFPGSFKKRHGLLRAQIAEAIKPLCLKQTKADAAFLAEFVAEAILTWTMSGCEFRQISNIILQLL